MKIIEGTRQFFSLTPYVILRAIMILYFLAVCLVNGVNRGPIAREAKKERQD